MTLKIKIVIFLILILSAGWLINKSFTDKVDYETYDCEEFEEYIENVAQYFLYGIEADSFHLIKVVCWNFDGNCPVIVSKFSEFFAEEEFII